MEVRKKFQSPFETAKEKGLKSEKDKVDIETDWDSPKVDTFFSSCCPDAFTTHPLAEKAHVYGSSLRKKEIVFHFDRDLEDK